MIPPREGGRTADGALFRPCVGVVLANGDGLVLAGRRADLALGGPAAWQMPQGGIDAGEDALAAASRELEEETGVPAALARVERAAEGPTFYEVPPDLRPPHWAGRWRGQALTWVLMRFLGRDEDVRVATAHPEFSDWRWMALPDLAAGVVAWKRPAYARALSEFGERP